MDHPPVPVARLALAVCDDGSEYNDGLGGWSGGRFDEVTGILTLEFARDPKLDDDTSETYGYKWGSAEHRFKLIRPFE